MITATPRTLSHPALEHTSEASCEPSPSHAAASPSPPHTPEAFDTDRPLPEAFRDKFGNLQINPYLDASGHSYHVQMSAHAPGVALRSLKRPVPNIPLRNMVRDFLRGDAQWRRNGESPISYELPDKAVMMVTLDGKAVGAGSAFDIEDVRAICQHDPRDPLTRMPLPPKVRIIPNLAVHALRLETEGSDHALPGTPTPAEHMTIDIGAPSPAADGSSMRNTCALASRIGAIVLGATVTGATLGSLAGSMVAEDYKGLVGWMQGGAIVGAFLGIAMVCSAIESDDDH